VTPVIGVLALQGDVVEHLQMLSARGARSVTVVAVRQGPLLAASFHPELPATCASTDCLPTW